MEIEPSIWARIFEFGAALFGYWWLIVPGGIFALEPMMESLFRTEWNDWLAKKWPRPARHKTFRTLSLFSLIIASFLAFDDVNSRNRVLQRELSGVRHLLPDQKVRLQNALKIKPDENYSVQINSTTSCMVSARRGFQGGSSGLARGRDAVVTDRNREADAGQARRFRSDTGELERHAKCHSRDTTALRGQCSKIKR